MEQSVSCPQCGARRVARVISSSGMDVSIGARRVVAVILNGLDTCAVASPRIQDFSSFFVDRLPMNRNSVRTYRIVTIGV